MASRCCFGTSAELRPKMGSFMDLPVVRGRLLLVELYHTADAQEELLERLAVGTR